MPSLESLFQTNKLGALYRAAKLPHLDEFPRDGLDYPEELIPFINDPAYVHLPLEAKRLIGTGALLSFLQDTLELELGMLNATTNAARKLHVNLELQGSLIETGAVQEGNHALQSYLQMNVTRTMRGYFAEIPLGHYVIQYEATRKPKGIRELLRPIARAGALEVDQSLLHRLAQSPSESTWQRNFHDAHWAEEQVHQNLYALLLRDVYKLLDQRGRDVFVSELVDAAWDLATFDTKQWMAIALNAGVHPAQAKELVEHATPEPAPAPGVVNILSEFGVRHERIWAGR